MNAWSKKKIVIVWASLTLAVVLFMAGAMHSAISNREQTQREGTQWLSKKPGAHQVQNCIEFGLRPDGFVVWRSCDEAMKDR